MQAISNLQVEPIVGIVETHCHLSDAYFNSDREKVIERARLSGVRGMIEVGCDLKNIPLAVELALANSDIRAAIGIHPVSADEWTPHAKELIESLIIEHGKKICAIGEIGLDYHWDKHPRDFQKQVLNEQLDLATQYSLPVVFHCRDAYPDLLDILEARSFNRGVLHCYISNLKDAQRATKLGLCLGFGGVLTYKKNDELRDVARQVPLDKILVETDCPYIAPQKWRGKRNEPACITEAVLTLAELFNKTPDEIARITAENAKRLFEM
jgi:TatD DNase family protein